VWQRVSRRAHLSPSPVKPAFLALSRLLCWINHLFSGFELLSLINPFVTSIIVNEVAREFHAMLWLPALAGPLTICSGINKRAAGGRIGLSYCFLFVVRP